MSAHKIPLKRDCQAEGCGLEARWVVRNTYNAEMGRFCNRHADALVADLRRRERE